jgi:hypothetical protein
MTPLSEHAAVVEAANKAWRFGYNKDFGEDNMRDIIADAVAKVCEPLRRREVTASDVAKWLSENKDRVAIIGDRDVLEIERVIHAIENKSQPDCLTICACRVKKSALNPNEVSK